MFLHNVSGRLSINQNKRQRDKVTGQFERQPQLIYFLATPLNSLAATGR